MNNDKGRINSMFSRKESTFYLLAKIVLFVLFVLCFNKNLLWMQAVVKVVKEYVAIFTRCVRANMLHTINGETYRESTYYEMNLYSMLINVYCNQAKFFFNFQLMNKLLKVWKFRLIYKNPNWYSSDVWTHSIDCPKIQFSPGLHRFSQKYHHL